VIQRAHRAALQVYRRLPARLRRTLVRAGTPNFTVGALAVVERADGRILLIRHVYRARWGLPGGLLKRREDPAVGVAREVLEETGLAVVLRGQPAVVVDGPTQRVDIVFRARPADGAHLGEIAPASPEIEALAWHDPEELPELQSETAGALVALARASAAPQSPALPALLDRLGLDDD